MTQPTPLEVINAKLDQLIILLGDVAVPDEPARGSLWQDFKERISSRKFLLTLAAIVTIAGNWIAGTVGDQAAILGITGALTAFIAGESYIDGQAAKVGKP